jgi:hypothetical protein
MRGRSCYTWGAVVFILSGALHTVAHLQPPPKEHASVYEAMANAKQTVAGMTFSVEGGMQLMSCYTSTFSVLAGLVALMLVGRCRDDAWLLRKLGALFALGAGVLAGFAFHYGIAPPALLYTITALLFAAAALRATKPAASTIAAAPA